MKTIYYSATLIILLLISSCSGGDSSQDEQATSNSKPAPRAEREESSNNLAEEEKVRASQRIDLETKGVGPIESIELPDAINQDMVAKGIEVYNSKCTACHKPDKTLVGPSPAGILERRSPEWIMNMILNPEVMVKEDPLAKDLFLEFNGSPMSNQNLTTEEARAVLEYFRTL